MSANAKDAHVPDELRRWSETFNNGVNVDEVDDEEVDSDYGEDGEEEASSIRPEEEENAGAVAGERDGNTTSAAHARVLKESHGGAARHCDEEEVSEDGYVQIQSGLFFERKIQGGLFGRKSKATVKRGKPQTNGIQDEKSQGEFISDHNYTQIGGGLQETKGEATATPRKRQRTTGTEIQDKKVHGECLRSENEMLRLQLVRTMKEHEAEQIHRLKLELLLKNKKIKSLKKQNEELRDEIEHYRRTAKPPRNPRLCRFCNKYVVGHDSRNCPERHASASSEQDEGDDSNQHQWNYAVL